MGQVKAQTAVTLSGLNPPVAEVSHPSRTKRWIASRYNKDLHLEDGKWILYNTASGVLWAVPPREVDRVQRALAEGVRANGRLSGSIKHLIDSQFLVPEGVDEAGFVRRVHRELLKTDQILDLTVMPTEQCNFRCVYCYESFLRPKMSPEVREGLKRLVERRAEKLQMLQVAWFGGEPLAALDVIRELSLSFLRTCAQHQVNYSSGMTTNGYLMKPEVSEELVKRLKVQTFQVTVDGPCEEHDQRRKLISGEGTFERIFSNLKAMKAIEGQFKAVIRINFDPVNHVKIPDFLGRLAAEFGEDKRFQVMFRAVERWGGPNDHVMPVFSQGEGERVANQLALRATAQGMRCYDSELIQPEGYVCYAAKPYSLVVGSDGTLYKCTVAFTNEKNHVGQLLPDGTLDLDPERFNLWVKDYVAEDKGCQSCFFLPSCQGSACPLIRIEHQRRPCPAPKRHFEAALRYTWESRKSQHQSLFG